jgi:hypothetical protein
VLRLEWPLPGGLKTVDARAGKIKELCMDI